MMQFLKIRECEHEEAELYFSGFPREEYWSGLPFPSPGDLPNPGIEPQSPALQADFLLSEPPNVIGNPNVTYPYNRILFGSRK